jgi:hypothetical protein
MRAMKGRVLSLKERIVQALIRTRKMKTSSLMDIVNIKIL